LTTASQASHGRIVEAIVAGDAEAARREMTDHLLLYTDHWSRTSAWAMDQAVAWTQ
jgi:DNA-binding FadR family transcriptional regulator